MSTERQTTSRNASSPKPRLIETERAIEEKTAPIAASAYAINLERWLETEEDVFNLPFAD